MVKDYQTLHDSRKSLVASPIPEPQTYLQVMRQPPTQRELWFTAMQSEFDSLTSKGVFELCYALLLDRTTVTLKIVNTIKYNADGAIQNTFVRQKVYPDPGPGLRRAYSPTVCLESVRLIASLACANDLDIEQVDVKTAYLNADLAEEIFCVPPAGFVVIVHTAGRVSLLPSATRIPSSSHTVDYLRIVKALYGLKQAGRMLTSCLIDTSQARRSQLDPCVFLFGPLDAPSLIIAIYVDDIIVAGLPQPIAHLKEALSSTMPL
jgi:hypothetical protein